MITAEEEYKYKNYESANISQCVFHVSHLNNDTIEMWCIKVTQIEL